MTIDPDIREHINVLWLVERENLPRSCAYFAGEYSRIFYKEMSVQHMKNLLIDLVAEGFIEADDGKRRGNYTRRLYSHLRSIPTKLKTTENMKDLSP